MLKIGIGVDQVGRFYVVGNGHDIVRETESATREQAKKKARQAFDEHQRGEAAAAAEAKDAGEEYEPEPAQLDTITLHRLTVSGFSPDNKTKTSKGETRASGPDLSIVNGTVAELEAALESGDYDSVLAELDAAERAGKNRSTAIEAIDDRMKDVADA